MPTPRTRRRLDKRVLASLQPAARDPVEPHMAVQQILALADEALRTGERPKKIASDDYRGPEEARGAPRTPLGDVFALGLLLHELLTGRRRYEGVSPWGAPAHRLFSTATDAEALVPDAPSGLRDIVARSLAWQPAERYPDVAAFADALRHWLANDRVGQTVINRGRARRVRPTWTRSTGTRSPWTPPTWMPTGRDAVLLILALLIVGFVGMRSVSWLGLLEGPADPTPEMAVQGGGGSLEPSPSPVEARRTPRTTVVTFFRRVERGAFQRAYRLMSDSLRAQVSPEQLAERYANTTGITVESLEVRRSGRAARVAVQVLEATTSGQTRRLQGWWVLILEDGNWVLEVPSF